MHRPSSTACPKAIRRHGVCAHSTMDGNDTNAAVLQHIHTEHSTAIAIRQVHYRDSIVE
jgi:hypothetical protein